MQVIKYDFLILLVNLFLLPQDDIPFPLNGRRLELRVLQNVRDDVYCLVDVLAERLGVVDGLLSRGVGVEVSSQVLDFELEGMLRSSSGTLEGHVFEEVGGSIGPLGFGSRASVDPGAYSGSLSGRVRFGSDGEAVGEDCGLGSGLRGGPDMLGVSFLSRTLPALRRPLRAQGCELS